MNDGPWRRYISFYTTEPIEIDANILIASLEKAFEEAGFSGPFNTETNAPNNNKNAPIVKVETGDGKSGVWIGSRLIFIPVGVGRDYERLFSALRNTELAQLSARSYSLNSSSMSLVSEATARETTNPEVNEILNNDKAQEFSKNVTKQLSDTLTAKDIITVARNESGGLIVDMTISIDSIEMASGQTVADLFTQIDFTTLETHENEIKQQAHNIITRQ